MARILFLTQSYVPSRRASGIQVMKMCEATAALGHEVELVVKYCPPRTESKVADDFAFYRVQPDFRIVKLPRPPWRGGGLVYAMGQIVHLLRRRSVIDLVFSRDPVAAYLAVSLRLPTVFESHGLPRGRVGGFLIRRVVRSPNLRRLVVISRALLKDLEARRFLPDCSVVVAHDATDAEALQGTERNRWSRPAGSRARIGYVGHLYPGRGIELLAELARRQPDFDFEVVGGHDSAVEEWRQKTGEPNLAFCGFVEPARLPETYARFDVLLMPYQHKVGVQSGKTDTSRWMSPIKMFEYMATGIPLVASDLPVLREVLENGRNALLVGPDDVAGWAAAISRLISDKYLARRIGAAARADIEDRHTWTHRAAKILEGVV